MPDRPKERMPEAPPLEEDSPPQFRIPDTGLGPVQDRPPMTAEMGTQDFTTKLQKKIKDRQEKIRNVKSNLNDPPLAKWLGEEDKTQQALGGGPNKVIVGKKGIQVVCNENEANQKPLMMTDDENEISPATGDMTLKADMQNVDFNNKILNKRLQTGPTNVYNHYPPVLTKPPKLLQSKARHVLKAVVIAAKVLEGLERGSRS